MPDYENLWTLCPTLYQDSNRTEYSKNCTVVLSVYYTFSQIHKIYTQIYPFYVTFVCFIFSRVLPVEVKVTSLAH